MVGSAVPEDHKELIFVTCGNLFQEYFHALGIHARQDKKIGDAIFGADGSIKIGVFANHLAANMGAKRGWNPASARILDAAEPGFIHEHHAQGKP